MIMVPIKELCFQLQPSLALVLPCSDLVFSGSYDQNGKQVKSRGNQVDLRQSLDIAGTLGQEFPGTIVIQWVCNSQRTR